MMTLSSSHHSLQFSAVNHHSETSQPIDDDYSSIFSQILLSNHSIQFSPREWATLLFQAVTQNDIQAVSSLLEWADSENLNHSATQQHLNSIILFNPMMADETSHGSTILHKACSLNHCEIVSMLLRRKDIVINVKDRGQATPLHYAASNGSLECVLLLLGGRKVSNKKCEEDNGIDSKDAFGNTPIHLAIKNRHYRVVTAILDFNPNLVNCRRSNSKTCLHLVVEQYDLEGLLLITKNHFGAADKIQLCAKDENGLTPLMQLIKDFSRMNDYSNANVNKSTKMRFLSFLISLYDLSEMSNVNKHMDHESRNLFHLSCINNSADVVRILALFLAREVYLKMLSQSDKSGQTPIHTACRYGADEVLNTFLLMLNEENTNKCLKVLEYQDKEGNTPLHCATIKLAILDPSNDRAAVTSFHSSDSNTSLMDEQQGFNNSTLFIVNKASSEPTILPSRIQHSSRNQTICTDTYVKCIEILFPLVSLDIENSKKRTVLDLLNCTKFFENSNIFSVKSTSNCVNSGVVNIDQPTRKRGLSR